MGDKIFKYFDRILTFITNNKIFHLLFFSAVGAGGVFAAQHYSGETATPIPRETPKPHNHKHAHPGLEKRLTDLEANH